MNELRFAGALIGLGIFTALWVVLPPARIDLAAALVRFDEPWSVPGSTAREAGHPRVIGWLVRQATRRKGLLLGVPGADLELLGRSVERFVLHRLALGMLGLALPGLLWTFCLATGIGIPVAIPVGVAITAAVALSLLPAIGAREDAAAARENFRAATSAYLDLVAQERASGRSPTQALIEAARVSQGWVFVRITERLARAPRAGITGWQALSDLSAEVGVAELADLADIIASAADGAAVYNTLTKKAASLRAAALAAEQAKANARSERLVLPVAMLAFGFIALVFYPALVRLLGG